MASIQHEKNREAIIGLKRFLYDTDADLESIDTMSAKEVQTELRAVGVNFEHFHSKLTTMLATAKPKERPTSLSEFMAEEIWVPRYAGQDLAAAAIPKEKTVFHTPYGKIDIEYTFGGQYYDDPAYIWLSWKADLSTDSALKIRFVNSETEKIYYEANLGRLRRGEETFTSAELGFDPTTEESWGICYHFSEKEA